MIEFSVYCLTDRLIVSAAVRRPQNTVYSIDQGEHISNM